MHVDRIGSAWLIRRFIDKKAAFKFVVGPNYELGRGEVSFDMFEATFTHVGDRCTFEVLIEQFELREPLGSLLFDALLGVFGSSRSGPGPAPKRK